MDKLIITVVLGLFLTNSQVAHGGYVQQGGYYSSSAIPTSFLRPALGYPQQQFVQVQQQKQPLQLRPPQSSSIPVALPNTRPPVTVVHAEQQRPLQQQQQFVTYPASAVATYPSVVAIQAQTQPLPVAAQVVSVPNYSFGYAVKDAVTGDEKSHEESRTGDNVVGKYTVVEPDGTLRTVTYTAGVNGFNAIVERTPGYAPPNAPVKVVAVSKPVAIATPIQVARPVPVSSVPSFGGHLIQPSLGYPYPAGFHFGG